MQILWGIGGMVVLLAIAFGLSTNRRAINPRTTLQGLQIALTVGARSPNSASGRSSPGPLANLMNATIAGILIG